MVGPGGEGAGPFFRVEPASSAEGQGCCSAGLQQPKPLYQGDGGLMSFMDFASCRRMWRVSLV